TVHERLNVGRIVLPVGIHGHDDVRRQLLGSPQTGDCRGSNAEIGNMFEDQSAFLARDRCSRIGRTIVHDDRNDLKGFKTRRGFLPARNLYYARRMISRPRLSGASIWFGSRGCVEPLRSSKEKLTPVTRPVMPVRVWFWRAAETLPALLRAIAFLARERTGPI